MTSTDRFAAFRLPLGLTEGVRIPLGNTGAVFLCRLPTSMNDEYQAAFMASLNIDLNEDRSVKVDFDPMQIRKVRQKLFFDTCIVSAEGIDDMPTAEFFAKYPLAAKYVYERAEELAEQSDKEVEVAMGNSGITSSGKSAGRAGKNSMKPSSDPESMSGSGSPILAH